MSSGSRKGAGNPSQPKCARTQPNPKDTFPMRRTPRDWQNPPSGTTWASFSAIDHPRKNSVVFRHTSAVGKVIHLSKLLFEIQSWGYEKKKGTFTFVSFRNTNTVFRADCLVMGDTSPSQKTFCSKQALRMSSWRPSPQTSLVVDDVESRVSTPLVGRCVSAVEGRRVSLSLDYVKELSSPECADHLVLSMFGSTSKPCLEANCCRAPSNMENQT